MESRGNGSAFRIHHRSTVEDRDPPEVFEAAMPEALRTGWNPRGGEKRTGKKLSGNAKILGAYVWARALWREGGIVSTSYPQMALAIDASERAARHCKDELIDAGFMELVVAETGRAGGEEFRVFGPGRLAQRYKLLNRPDRDQLTLWPLVDADKPGRFSTESAGFADQLFEITSSPTAPAVGEEEKTKANSNSTLILNSLSERGNPANSASIVERCRSRCQAINKALYERLRKPHSVKLRIIVLAALLAEGEAVGFIDNKTKASGGRVRLTPDAIDSALKAALSKEPDQVGKCFYYLLKDRICVAAKNPAARVPHEPLIRAACERIGWPWKDDWDSSPKEEAERRRQAGMELRENGK